MLKGRLLGDSLTLAGPTCQGGRRAFTILEMLTSFGIVSFLAALILPAIGSSREAARRIECLNHLRQIGFALHSYHDQYRSLPAGWQVEPTEQTAYGWAVPILPYLEDVPPTVDQTVQLSHARNDAARHTRLSVFLCPSDISEPMFPLFEENEVTGEATALGDLPTANYLGVYGTPEADDEYEDDDEEDEDDDGASGPGDGAFINTRRIAFSQLRGGLSNTILVGERTMAWLPSTWLGVDLRGEDSTCRLVGSALTAPNCSPCDECEFSSRHSKGANFLFGDGHVKLLSNEIESGVYRRMARRSGM